MQPITTTFDVFDNRFALRLLTLVIEARFLVPVPAVLCVYGLTVVRVLPELRLIDLKRYNFPLETCLKRPNSGKK